MKSSGDVVVYGKVFDANIIIRWLSWGVVGVDIGMYIAEVGGSAFKEADDVQEEVLMAAVEGEEE